MNRAVILGYDLRYAALGHGGMARIGMLQFGQPVVSIVPIVSIILAAALLAEPIGTTPVLGTATVLVGLWFAVRVPTAARFREST